MTTANQEIRETWALLFPDAPIPPERQWALWMILHDQETVKNGLAQLAAKFAKLGGSMDLDYMVKFASSVMNRLSRERSNL